MKKVTGVAAMIGLGISLTWAAGQVGEWLGFQQQPATAAQDESPGEEEPPGNEGLPSNASSRNGNNLPSNTPPRNEDDVPPAGASVPELSVEAASIEEDLARIEEALGSDEVLEEFTPSEPLSADNPIPMPTDI